MDTVSEKVWEGQRRILVIALCWSGLVALGAFLFGLLFALANPAEHPTPPCVESVRSVADPEVTATCAPGAHLIVREAFEGAPLALCFCPANDSTRRIH